MEMVEQYSSVRARILLVDDDPLLREIASCNLETCGYEVTVAEDGQKAAEHLKNNTYDLLITDIDMPKMDGLALTRLVRESAAHATLPILIITGKDQNESVDGAYSAGATSFLAKPINWELFTRSVKFVLQSAKTEKDLRAAKDMALSAVKLKQSILSNLTHEMRTPLNHIMGFADVLKLQNEVRSNEQILAFVGNIQAGGDRMLSLIKDILFLSEAESGSISLTPTAFNPSLVLQKTKELCAADAEAKSMTIKLYNGDESLSVSLDQNLLQRAMGQLMDNAVKFAPKESEIQCGFMVNTQTGRPFFFVKDQGPGVPPSKIAALGQSFIQLDMRRNRKHHGMGVGLKICSIIATAFGGEIIYNNIDGGGFMVALSLPSNCLLRAAPTQARLIA